MRIIVTGSQGTVGKWLSKILKERGHEVLGLDLFHHPDGLRCDVGEYRQLEEAFRWKPNLVYHAAAEFGRWNGEGYYEQLWRTNAVGTKNIIRLQEKQGFRLVHFSSSEVYGDYPGLMEESVMEKEAVPQMNDYAMTKWVNEMQIRNSRLQFGTESVVVRLFNTYGPGEYYHPYRSVNARFCHHALHSLPITVYRGHKRTSTYLEDTCQTLANISENFIPGETYNIGGEEYHDIETLADFIWTLTGADRSLITYAEAEAMTTKQKMVDVSKAVRDLGHKNTVSLKEGIRRTLCWMRTL